MPKRADLSLKLFEQLHVRLLLGDRLLLRLDLIAARHIHRAELNAKQRRDHHAKAKQTIRKADRHIWKKHLPQRVHSEQQQTGRQCDPSPHTPPKQTQEILRKLCLIQHK